MLEGTRLRTFAGKCRCYIVKIFIQVAFKLSTFDGFIDTVNERIADPRLRSYLVALGADKLFDNLYMLAGADSPLRGHLLEDAAARMFRSLYAPALGHISAREYLIAYGIDDLYRNVYAMALELDVPLAQRAGGYGQEGEDLVLTRLFDGRATGFYVDVGAHHPFRFSNTYLLYLRGWHGINIDATPGSMTAFKYWRPRDINIECMVSSDTMTHTYYQYGEPALNTISADVVKKREVESPQYSVIGTTTLQARPLAAILAEHLPPSVAIDLMNVDVEGLDFEVLKSNDWDQFRPRVIVVELLWTDFSDMKDSEIHQLLTEKGYRLHSKLFNSAIFSL